MLVTSDTTSPVTTEMEPGDHVADAASRSMMARRQEHRWKRGEHPNGYEGVAYERQSSLWRKDAAANLLGLNGAPATSIARVSTEHEAFDGAG
ncbi:hypothetical protein ZWY2020_049222 [Hordeum vulgare]|nr:hypothetical protein ZWY2020_049222 [Hordeum vulgare]